MEDIATINLDVIYHSNEYHNDPEAVKLELSYDTRVKILELQEQMLNDRTIFSINLDHGATEYYVSNEETGDREVHEDFRSGVEYIIVYPHACFYYAQSKYDASNNFEAGGFIVNEDLNIKLYD